MNSEPASSDPAALVVAGGTGGHIVPGLALARELQQRVRVVFLSLERNRGYADFQNADFPIELYAAPRIPALRRPFELALFPLRALRAYLRARGLMRKYKVGAVIGMGGYSVLPALLAARMAGLPFYLCEQNAAPGRATRFFAKSAETIFLNFPVSDAARSRLAVPEDRLQLLGNPLRAAIRGALAEHAGRIRGARQAAAAPEESGKSSPETEAGPALQILILGGSQGAVQLNELTAAVAPRLADRNIQWLLQCGEANLEAMQQKLPPHAFPNVRLFGYHSAMHELYLQADIVICRAGAGVLSECLAFGLPIVAVPYPYSADNHQQANAEYLAERGAARLIVQNDARPEELLGILRELADNPEARRRMQERALALAIPDAAERIAGSILSRPPFADF